MPKENIDDYTTDGFRVEVLWLNDAEDLSGHVQIATTNKHSEFEFPEVRTEGHYEASEKFFGWSVSLDEQGLDRLISNLKRAKRKAFRKGK